MNSKPFLLAGLLLVTIFVIGFSQFNIRENTEQKKEAPETAPSFDQAFLNQGLLTNTDKRSIPLDEVLNGGPGKDGIPSINEPNFISISEAQKKEAGETEGLAVSINGDARFYPYTVLVWHEIVNDIVGGVPIAATFCPLCGSGIVFGRTLETGLVNFGVSGFLWESNLLMYDSATETLWSQAKGEAVIGEQTGIKLSVIDSDLITFDSFVAKYPDGKVLSRETGHIRNYGFYPYGDYEENDQYIFPVSNTDTRFDGKELMYVVPVGSGSAAFPRAALIESGGATLVIGEETLTASVDQGSITVTTSDGTVLPGYHEMWFSWATHHGDTGVVWEK